MREEGTLATLNENAVRMNDSPNVSDPLMDPLGRHGDASGGRFPAPQEQTQATGQRAAGQRAVGQWAAGQRPGGGHDAPQAEMNLQSILRCVPHGLCALDSNWELQWANPALRQWVSPTGKAGDCLSGTPFQVLFGSQDEYRDYQKAALASVRVHGSDTREALLRRADGSRFWCEISIARNDPSETGRGYVAALSDATARKRAEDAEMKASRMEATATLAGGIAHEFNNLMVPVVGYAELLAQDLRDRPEILNMLQIISRSAKRAGELAQQMLAFARSGRFISKAVSLNGVVARAFASGERPAPERIKIERRADARLWDVMADPAQIDQAFRHLLANAVEAIEGEGRIAIATRNVDVDEAFAAAHPGLKAGHHAYLAVEDTGCGMDGATVARVFEPFFSTKFAGRGLGLAAVYGIVKNHGGFISVSSELGKGSVFEVYLPAAIASEIRHLARHEEAPTGSETILIIDDEPLVLHVTGQILERLGYQVLAAPNGKEAVEIAQTFEGEIHLALLDLAMPVMDGKQTFPLLRQSRPAMKIVICSGYDLNATARSLIKAGACGFVQKPFRISAIAPAIRATLDGQGNTPVRA